MYISIYGKKFDKLIYMKNSIDVLLKQFEKRNYTIITPYIIIYFLIIKHFF